MNSALHEMELPFRLGDRVCILSGPVKGQSGVVESIDGFTGEVLYAVRISHDKLNHEIITSFTARALAQAMPKTPTLIGPTEPH